MRLVGQTEAHVCTAGPGGDLAAVQDRRTADAPADESIRSWSGALIRTVACCSTALIRTVACCSTVDSPTRVVIAFAHAFVWIAGAPRAIITFTYAFVRTTVIWATAVYLSEYLVVDRP